MNTPTVIGIQSQVYMNFEIPVESNSDSDQYGISKDEILVKDCSPLSPLRS